MKESAKGRFFENYIINYIVNDMFESLAAEASIKRRVDQIRDLELLVMSLQANTHCVSFRPLQFLPDNLLKQRPPARCTVLYKV